MQRAFCVLAGVKKGAVVLAYAESLGGFSGREKSVPRAEAAASNIRLEGLQSLWRRLVREEVVANETADFVGIRGTDQSYADTVTSSLRESVVAGRRSNS